MGPGRRAAGNLPFAATSFVGRLREIGEVRTLLETARLVTLTGAGGVGKTRLALEVATRAGKAFADGVWLVDLAAVRDPEQVAQAVVTSLGLLDQSACRPRSSSSATSATGRRSSCWTTASTCSTPARSSPTTCCDPARGRGC